MTPLARSLSWWIVAALFPSSATPATSPSRWPAWGPTDLALIAWGLTMMPFAVIAAPIVEDSVGDSPGRSNRFLMTSWPGIEAL
jgi:hypothetical protein